LGVEIHLERVPLREEGMNPYEILLSESQERMLIIADKKHIGGLERLAKDFNLKGVVIGETIGREVLRAFFKGELVVELPIRLITQECPVYHREVKKPIYVELLNKETSVTFFEEDLPGTLRKLISSPNVASKRWIYSQYDYQVGTNTLVFPGGDSAVLRLKWVELPEIRSDKGIALSSEGNGRLVFLNPYEGAKYVVAEACRNVACVGAKPLAITDCLNFGNPERPEIMWQFKKSIEGIEEACRSLNVPVVSGNVSFYNETVEEGQARNVYPTPIVVAVGVVEDVNRITTHSFKDEDEVLLIGDLRRTSTLGGSEYLKAIHGLVNGPVPEVNLEKEARLIELLRRFSSEGKIRSAHDVSTGGLLICILESLFGTGLGAVLDIYCDERPDYFLFSEMPTRVVVSVEHKYLDYVKESIEETGLDWLHLGQLNRSGELVVKFNGKEILKERVSELEEVWKKSLEQEL
jgi:phosphoribosylformylglycinamidine synthase